MIVVTGATGHIGNVLVRELIIRDQTVRALVLPDDDCRPLAGLDTEIIYGDVTPYDVYTGRHLKILQKRKEAKYRTLQVRRAYNRAVREQSTGR